MKRLLFFLLLLPALAFSQQKISEMPTYIGNPNGSWVPIVQGNTNRKVDAAYFGYKKVDSISVSFGGIYDTTYVWKVGAKSYFYLTRASGGGGSSAWTDITGKPTTLSGYGITDAAALSHTHTFSSLTSKPTTLSGYGITDAQALLVSGTNIKTINGTSVLGSGDITVSGGSLPSQTGNAGKYLTTNGTTASWQSDSASLPIGASLKYNTGVLDVDPVGASAAINKSITVSTQTYTVGAGINQVFATYVGGTITITLPSASANLDREITITNLSTNNLTVTPAFSGTANTFVTNNSGTFHSNGTDWICTKHS